MGMNIEDINNIQLDVLKEIGNIGAGNAATALAEMIRRKVDMEVPKVKILRFNEVSDILGGSEKVVVGILLHIEGDLKGNIMFVLEIKAARELINMMLENVSLDISDFDELEISAIKEIGNILCGSYISALSTLTGLRITASVPEMAIDMAGAIVSVPAIEFGMTGDAALYIETGFLDGETRVMGDFFLVPEPDSYNILLKSLGVIA
jgi:chemotaxis protein CheC